MIQLPIMPRFGSVVRQSGSSPARSPGNPGQSPFLPSGRPPQAGMGDLTGESSVVQLGARTVDVVINQDGDTTRRIGVVQSGRAQGLGCAVSRIVRLAPRRGDARAGAGPGRRSKERADAPDRRNRAGRAAGRGTAARGTGGLAAVSGACRGRRPRRSGPAGALERDRERRLDRRCSGTGLELAGGRRRQRLPDHRDQRRRRARADQGALRPGHGERVGSFAEPASLAALRHRLPHGARPLAARALQRAAARQAASEEQLRVGDAGHRRPAGVRPTSGPSARSRRST